MTRSEARLMPRQHIISFQDGSELAADHSLNKFRQEYDILQCLIARFILILLILLRPAVQSLNVFGLN